MTEPQHREVSVDGLSLGYLEWTGERGPLLLLPGLTGHKGSFRTLAARLSPTYQIYAVDLRGRGDSDKPPEGYGFAYHTRDLLAFLEALGIDKLSIIGHSFGATVGVYLASIRPSLVEAAVLIDGGADPNEEVLQAMRPAVRRLGATFPSMDAYLAAMREIPYFNPWNAALERYLQEDMQELPEGGVRSKSSAQAIEQDLDIHFFYSMCVHFPTMQCPTLFLRPEQGLLGDKAHVLTPKEAAAFVAWIPKGRQVDVPGVNHYTILLQEDPPVVVPILSFLAEVLEPAEVKNL